VFFLALFATEPFPRKHFPHVITQRPIWFFTLNGDSIGLAWFRSK